MRPWSRTDPVDILVEEHDPVRRARAHTALGLLALEDEDVDGALVHLREAVDLDPTDEVPKDALRQIGARAVTPPPPATGFASWLQRLRRR